jgi:hypothetical protein
MPVPRLAHRWLTLLVAVLTLASCGVRGDAAAPSLVPLTVATQQGTCTSGDASFCGPDAARLHVITVVTDPQQANYLRAAQVAHDRGFKLTTLVADAGTLGPRHGVGFATKLRLVSTFVNGVADNDTVLFLDGYDTLIQARGPQALLAQYAAALATYHAPAGAVLMAAERNCFPDAGLADSYPVCGVFPDSPYRYLNAGAYIGSAASLRTLFHALGVATLPAATDDQRALTALHLGGTARDVLFLDTGARLFFCLALGVHDAVPPASPGGLWTNAATNSTPGVIHGNGFEQQAFLFDSIYPTLAAHPPSTPGGDVAPVKQQVLIATPLYGGMAQAAYMRSILDLVILLRSEGIGVEWHYLAHESLIPRARNSLVHTFLTECPTCSHLLFVDADVGFKAPDVLAMLRSGKEVVGAPYVKKGVNWNNVAAAVKAQPEEPPSSLARVMGYYVINFAAGTQQISLDKPVEVKEIGTGLLLIARPVFGRLAAAYPQRKYTNDEGDPNTSVWAFFDAGIDAASGRYLSEDYFFCHLWRAIGGTVWLCPWVKTTHTGPYDFPGDLVEVARRLGRLFQA